MLTNDIVSFEQLGPDLCSSFIHFVRSNDSDYRQWRPWSDCADLGLRCHICPETQFCIARTILYNEKAMAYEALNMRSINIIIFLGSPRKHMTQGTTKPTIRLVWPAKAQISLCIHAVWSESSLIACAFYSLWAVQRRMNRSPCHTGWMNRLIYVIAGHQV